jgi:hypothetical protein
LKAPPDRADSDLIFHGELLHGLALGVALGHRALLAIAEERLILRELQGLLPQEIAQPFMEDHGILMSRRAAGRAGQTTICSMRRPRS